MPGVSAFSKDGDGRIFRVGRAEFGPGDNFCAIWHFFELLPRGDRRLGAEALLRAGEIVADALE